ncbi:MAG: four helix bundle protein [Bacteroidales bacterium]|nr:four helix bundle protein [Bacteroidales bacterium]
MNEQENNVSFFRFEDLRIYAKAMDYIVWLYGEFADVPSSNREVDCLKESFLNAAQEIALHTAEGSSRNKTQFLYYLKMAKSSVRECVVFTEIATRRDLFTKESKEYSRNQLMELTKMIGSLIASLQRSNATAREEHEDDFDMQLPSLDDL